MTESGGSRTPLATTGEIAEAIADLEFGPWLAQASILVVDDEPGVRNFLVRILKPRCKRIEEASDAKEASRKLDEQHFDLVILDNLMPRKSGLDWLAALRVGVVDFVLKPFARTSYSMPLRAVSIGRGCSGRMTCCAMN
jgi:hypothetical protein